MIKFEDLKPGVKVRIGQPQGHWAYSVDMRHWAGQVMTIREIPEDSCGIFGTFGMQEDYDAHEGPNRLGWFWEMDDFVEIVDENPKPALTVDATYMLEKLKAILEEPTATVKEAQAKLDRINEINSAWDTLNDDKMRIRRQTDKIDAWKREIAEFEETLEDYYSQAEQSQQELPDLLENGV